MEPVPPRVIYGNFDRTHETMPTVADLQLIPTPSQLGEPQCLLSERSGVTSQSEPSEPSIFDRCTLAASAGVY
jgi:hypothetical protein